MNIGIIFSFISLFYNPLPVLKVYVRIELYLELKKVNFYTLVKETTDREEEISETEDFFNRFENSKGFQKDIELLATWIYDIGEKRGAKHSLFRPEDDAQALPPPTRYLSGKDAGQLRLYCIRLSDQIVILANGDIKTADKVIDCPNILPKFRFANSISKQLTQLIKEGEITLNRKRIEGINDTLLEY